MKRLALFLAALLLALALPSCAKSGLSEDEIHDTVQSLVEASLPLNVIYYGDGLPYVDDPDAVAALLGIAAGTDFSVNYMPAAPDAPFQSEEAIKDATDDVFSPAMCEMLYEIAFTGVSTEDEDKVAFARYIQQDGVLTVRIDLAEDALDMSRTFDFDAMEILIDETSRLRVEVPSFLAGKPSVPVRITLIKTPEGWRLDSPTY